MEAFGSWEHFKNQRQRSRPKLRDRAPSCLLIEAQTAQLNILKMVRTLEQELKPLEPRLVSSAMSAALPPRAPRPAGRLQQVLHGEENCRVARPKVQRRGSVAGRPLARPAAPARRPLPPGPGPPAAAHLQHPLPLSCGLQASVLSAIATAVARVADTLRTASVSEAGSVNALGDKQLVGPQRAPHALHTLLVPSGFSACSGRCSARRAWIELHASAARAAQAKKREALPALHARLQQLSAQLGTCMHRLPNAALVDAMHTCAVSSWWPRLAPASMHPP